MLNPMTSSLREMTFEDGCNISTRSFLPKTAQGKAEKVDWQQPDQAKKGANKGVS